MLKYFLYCCSTDGSDKRIAPSSVIDKKPLPVDDTDAYRKIQRGGEIPISGLQKPAPDKGPSKYCFLKLLDIYKDVFTFIKVLLFVGYIQKCFQFY